MHQTGHEGDRSDLIDKLVGFDSVLGTRFLWYYLADGFVVPIIDDFFENVCIN
jgi:hypothetical protein